VVNLLVSNFLGKTPRWYKLTILAFLIINPIVFFFVSPFWAGWLLLLQFIFTLAMATKCYPVPSGGLLALQAVIIGLTSPESVYKEALINFPVILLLIFMVAAIYYIKDIIFLVFTKLFTVIRDKRLLSLVFCFICAILAAFLDALAIMAAIIAVCFNLLAMYNNVAAALSGTENGKAEMEEFKGFLRNVIMHGAVGTVLGGNMTIVGVPHNLMIASKMGWSFSDFFQHCAAVSIPVIIAGLILCLILETVKFPGFGYKMPESAYNVIVREYKAKLARLSRQSLFSYILQGIVLILLFVSLALHLAEVGLIGIALMVVVAAFGGLIKEHDFAEAFNNAMPFVLLILIFFAVLAVVEDQSLVTPLVQWVFTFGGKVQLLMLYFANGALSAVSDNVFIASVFIKEVEQLYLQGLFSNEWYSKLAVAVSIGTNVPAIATPNGHAALLFLLTSSLAPKIDLSYWQMVKLTLPYTIAMTVTGGAAIYFFM